MGRSHAKTHSQPDDYSCGPAALKTALEIINSRHTLSSLTQLCKTSKKNGASVKNLIRAANQLGVSVLCVEWATLRHLQAALKPNSVPKSAIVNFLIKDSFPYEETGHYATVASYSSRESRIFLFDPSSGKKISYKWTDFIDRWYDYDFKRIRLHHRRYRKFRLQKRWYNRLLMIFAKDVRHLPKFSTPTAKIFPA